MLAAIMARWLAGGGLLIGGAATFVVVHSVAVLVWPRVDRATGVTDAWWLDSTSTVVAVFVLMTVTSWFALRSHRRSLVASAITWPAGAMLAMAIGLFIVGPGNIWPLVLIVGWGIIGIAAALAAWVVLLTEREPNVHR